MKSLITKVHKTINIKTCPQNVTVGITDDDIDGLQSMEGIDPEVRPGLFQGDMALNNEVTIRNHTVN